MLVVRLIGMDWRNPDYPGILRQRAERLMRIRTEPFLLGHVMAYYRENLADFINDWGVTVDQRVVGSKYPDGRPMSPFMPFILFDAQREFVNWTVDRWRAKEDGGCDKSRDMGASWLAVAVSVAICVLFDGAKVGFGSRKEQYVDRSGDAASLFWKARTFIDNLPAEFRGGCDTTRDAPFMRISFPSTGSAITGEAGDNIGRGDRTSLYFVDEAAYLERPQLVDLSLSATTNCRIDISSANGMSNPFAQKKFAGKLPWFTLFWRSHPLKDQAWYDRECAKKSPIVMAQEVDVDYSASAEGVVIPAEWIRSAIDAHLRLGIVPTGDMTAAYDPADTGIDANAVVGGHGILINYIEQWMGKNSDIYKSVERVFTICDRRKYAYFRYDADGLGAGVRGDAAQINSVRRLHGSRSIEFEAFRGSGAVQRPAAEDVKGRRNEDYFGNYKAQSWINFRMRFERTHKWIHEGVACNPDEIVSISSACPDYMRLVGELSQPVMYVNQVGKVFIDKQPAGTKSPNLADAAMMRFAQMRGSLRLDPSLARGI